MNQLRFGAQKDLIEQRGHRRFDVRLIHVAHGGLADLRA